MATIRSGDVWLFRVGALWNLAVGLGALLFPRWTIALFHGDEFPSAALAFFYFSGFAGCVVLFGIGYWLVSLDVRQNHGLVVLGILGKLGVVLFFPYRVWVGDTTAWILLPAAIDLFFVVLYADFLRRRH